MSGVDIEIILKIFDSVFGLEDGVTLKILKFFPIVLLVEQLNASMKKEVALIRSHSNSIYYRTLGNSHGDYFSEGLDHECSKLVELLNIFQMKARVRLALLVGLSINGVCMVVLMNNLVDQVDKERIAFEVGDRNAELGRVNLLIELRVKII